MVQRAVLRPKEKYLISCRYLCIILIVKLSATVVELQKRQIRLLK